jgi:two-component system response regulator FlrC
MAETVLLVDSEGALREILGSILTSAGYEFHGASNGIEALALLDSGTKVDVIVSEWMMPGMDGLELLERVKQKHPAIPFVFSTGVYDSTIIEALIRNGACDYLPKPFKREHLLAVLRRAQHERFNPLDTTQLLARVKTEAGFNFPT